MPAPAPPSSPARSFDAGAAARTVQRLAGAEAAPWLHREVARRMADRLPVIKHQPRRVLDWWSGLGDGGQVLATAYPRAALVRVEPDAAWQARTQRRLQRPWWSPKRWQGGDPVLLSEQVPAGGADLLWANMMLHAVADPQLELARWQRALAADGFLMFSTLGPGTLAELRALYDEAGWPPPMAPLVDMHDLGDMLVHAGFADPVMDQETLTLTWPSPQALLAELRGLGGNVHPQRAAGLRTPRWRQRLHDALARRADAQGRIALAFEVVYGHAFNAPPRALVQAETAVSLDAMRAMVRAGRSNPG